MFSLAASRTEVVLVIINSPKLFRQLHDTGLEVLEVKLEDALVTIAYTRNVITDSSDYDRNKERS